MPLPDAPPTDQSRIYREFASKTALPGASGAITADLIDSFKNSLFLDEFSEDELRRLVLLQMATGTGSMSGPMPDTQTVSSASLADDGLYTTFTPGVGEVWQIVGVSASLATGITRIEFKLYDASTSTYVEVGEATASGAAELEGYPIVVGYPCTFVSHARGTHSSGTNITYFSVVRVR